jgi:nucleotide-binding universal stress UspA family protein
MFDNILIGVDGRRGGRDAIALAKRLAAPGASFTLAHVSAGGPFSWWGRHMAEERFFDREASMLDAERQSAAIQAGIVCVGGVPPARGLHDLARERAADLLVVGCSRRALLGRVLLGDDARASLEGAPCAFAIAPHGYAESAAPLVEIGVGYDRSVESDNGVAARG